MSEYKKINDYMIEEREDLPRGLVEKSLLRHVFNFRSRQVNVITEHYKDNSWGDNQVGLFGSNQESFNFRHFESQEFIQEAYDALKEKDGNPPPLDEKDTKKKLKSMKQSA